ncbi:hypothetical protein HELRODRAFT_188887 [Helobdella robusta]|uniref:C1q domain-containing protein n=1 Tax=Helobdella robusta TaxID=6412 RepID=T1FQF8_HELRO|nr:hypothetical protein HELRODRAFT_188887 [Helobdella robusta]ESN98706.1 hypothetical protein HELRODRAFT_188887 [Helobdella robusta]
MMCMTCRHFNHLVNFLLTVAVIMLFVELILAGKTRHSKMANRERSVENNQLPTGNSVTSEAYCDLELNCKGDMLEMPTPMKLPIRGARGPAGHKGEKGEKGEGGAPGMDGMPGMSPPSPSKVAFFVGLQKEIQSVTNHTTVVFDKILTNVGNGYDQKTGKFKAPVSGTYFFNVVVSANTKDRLASQAAVILVKNGGMIVTVWAEAFPNWATSSNVAILNLVKDDQVWLFLINRAPNLYGNMYSSFSGFLLFENAV